MRVHVLLFDDSIERISCDERKISEMVDNLNGPGLVGPYYMASFDLEDIPDNIPHKTMISLTQERELVVHDYFGKPIGRLNFNDKNITFDGNVDETANRIFSFLKHIIDPYFKRS